MMDQTDVIRGPGNITVRLAAGEPVRHVNFECVLDCHELDGIVGIEILSFHRQLGASPPPGPTTGSVPWSYDDEVDAFYTRLGPGTAPKQMKSKGRASIDNDGVVVALEVSTETSSASDA